MTSKERKFIKENMGPNKSDPFYIDKIGFRVPKMLVNMDYKRINKAGASITMKEIGENLYVYFHDVESTNEKIIYTLLRMIAIDNSLNPHPVFSRNITISDIEEYFTISEFETAFDFYLPITMFNFNLNIKSMKCVSFKNGTSTFYSCDDKTIYATKKPEEAEIIKDRLKSFIIVYNRGHKIKSKQNITRLEFRFKRRYISRFKMEYLWLTPLGISRKIRPIIIKILKKILKPHSIFALNSEILKILHPYLYNIMVECLQVYPSTKDLINLKETELNTLGVYR